MHANSQDASSALLVLSKCSVSKLVNSTHELNNFLGLSGLVHFVVDFHLRVRAVVLGYQTNKAIFG